MLGRKSQRLDQSGPSDAGVIEIEFAARPRLQIAGAVDAATWDVAVAESADGRPR
jgi:hypothetical protein